jgi:hypothetical protein
VVHNRTHFGDTAHAVRMAGFWTSTWRIAGNGKYAHGLLLIVCSHDLRPSTAISS